MFGSRFPPGVRSSRWTRPRRGSCRPAPRPVLEREAARSSRAGRAPIHIPPQRSQGADAHDTAHVAIAVAKGSGTGT